MNAVTPGAEVGDIRAMALAARDASRQLAASGTETRNGALLAAADALDAARDAVFAANERDMQRARERNIDAALLDRLELTLARFASMLDGIRQVAALPDPVGAVRDLDTRPSGIRVGKMRVPLGVIGIIYESRPNVTADAASLCLKSGNATLLRGGSEALHSNTAIAAALAEGVAGAGLDPACIQLIESRDREVVSALVKLEGLVDVIIPRGGRGLIERINAEARVPVIKHLDGVCHVYIDEGADLAMAQSIAVNAKTHSG